MQTEAAAEAEALGIIMMRREDDPNNASPPTTRVYKQDGDDFRVAAVPVLGATYSLGKQLLDYIDLSDTVCINISYNSCHVSVTVLLFRALFKYH